MAEGRAHPRGEQFSELNSQLSQAVGHFTSLLSAATSFGQAVNQFRSLETQLTMTNAAAGGTAESFNRMSEAARSFAFATTASAQESASALFYLAQAGFSVEQALNSMSGVMILAQATMQDVAFTSDLVSSTLTTFNMTSLDSMRIANLFAAAQANSLASLDKLAFSLRQAGPVAFELGQNIETTVAFLDELYNAGLRGEQAGTALRNIMVRLIDPPKAAREVLSKYGIEVKDTAGNVRELEDVLQDLFKAGISEGEAAKLFGVEALSGALTLIRSVGTGSFDAQRDAISGTSAAIDMAVAQMDTLDGSLKLARNAMNDLFLTFGEAVAPAIRIMADAVQSLVVSFNSLDPALRSNIATAVAVGLAFTTMAGALKAMMFVTGPTTSLLGALFGSFSKANGATQSVTLLSRAMTGLRTAFAWMTTGGLTSSILGIGTSITGVSANVGTLRQVFTTLNGVRFIPLIAGIGAVGAAIVGGGGLIYAIYRIVDAWREANRLTEIEIAKQRDFILEAANMSSADVGNLSKRGQQRDTKFDMAESLPEQEAAGVYQSIIKAAELDRKRIEEAIAAVNASTDGVANLSNAVGTAQRIAVDLRGQYEHLTDSASVASRLTDMADQVRNNEAIFDDLTLFVESLYSPERLAQLQVDLADARQRKANYDSSVEYLRDSGLTEDDKTLADAITSASGWGDRVKSLEAEITRMSQGVQNDPAIKGIAEASDIGGKLLQAITAAAQDGSLTPEEAAGIRSLQDQAATKLSAIGAAIYASREALNRQLTEFQALAAQGGEQEARARTLIAQAAGGIISNIATGELDLTEFFGDQTDDLSTFLQIQSVSTAATENLRTQLLAGQQFGRDMLFNMLLSLQQNGQAVPPELLAMIQQAMTGPVDKLIQSISVARGEAIVAAAKARNDLALFQADIDNNLAAGIQAETMDATLTAVEDMTENLNDATSEITDALGGTAWMSETISAAAAEAAGHAEWAGQTLGEVLSADALLAGVYDGLQSGADPSAVADVAGGAAADMDAAVALALSIIAGQIDKSSADADGAFASLAALGNKFSALFSSVSGFLSGKVKSIPTSKPIVSKYTPGKGGGGGGGGGSAKDEAQKLKEDFEKELRDVQKTLLATEKDILEFDSTIDFTARFNAMLDIDRREVALKYDQKIQEIKSDIEAANEKFSAQPAQLSQLVTGYNQLITQLERAKQAELEYTNSFTRQSELRNKAIDHQIDAIRNMSKAGEEAGIAILQGVQAGFLLYQKDMKTTVDNVAKATVGVLDGLAEAVGAFVTGSGDAMEVLRNAVMNSLNQLIVDATKRMLQEMLSGLTGAMDSITGQATQGAGGGGGFLSSVLSAFTGGNVPAATGATATGAVAGVAAQTAPAATGAVASIATQTEAAQMQVVFQQFLSQLQLVLQQFVQTFSVTLQQSSAAGGIGGAGGLTGAAPVTGTGGVATNTAEVAGAGAANPFGGLLSSLQSMFQSLFGGLLSSFQSIFGSLFGGAGGGIGSFFGLFDNGGYIPKNGFGIAGEFGPEIVRGPANVTSRRNTMSMLRSSQSASTATTAEPPTINNIIVQDQAVVAKYLSTSSGRKQIANIVRQTQNPQE